MRKKGGIFGATVNLVQFPIKLAHVITSHKIQGQTVDKPLTATYNLMNIFEEAQGYVMLSHVEELLQTFIIDDFDPDKIYPSSKALKELERMNKVSLNHNPSPWNKTMENSVKILSMNCAGLKPHYDDVKNDAKIKRADMIYLVETSLSEEDELENFPLSGYTIDGIKAGAGKGITSYFNPKTFKRDNRIESAKYQVLKFCHDSVDVIGIYRSQLGDSVMLLQDLNGMINPEKTTLIVGDMNICYRENFQNRFI